MQGEQTPGTAPNPAAMAEEPFAARLLYVEDNVQIAEITCMMLEDIGLEIIQAASAEEALAIVGEGEGPPPFDIGFSDELAMGYGGQYELLRKPFTRGALVDSLQRHLDNAIYLTA